MVPATWEAEARELLEPRWDCGELRSRHCTPAWCLATEQDSVLEKKERKRKENLHSLNFSLMPGTAVLTCNLTTVGGRDEGLLAPGSLRAS